MVVVPGVVSGVVAGVVSGGTVAGAVTGGVDVGGTVVVVVVVGAGGPKLPPNTATWTAHGLDSVARPLCATSFVHELQVGFVILTFFTTFTEYAGVVTANQWFPCVLSGYGGAGQ